MGASDGSVLGSVKIVDHGENLERWNLVVMGDGYRASEMGTFHNDVRRFIAALRARAPFGELWNAVNVVRVDVASDESGADRQAGGAVAAVNVDTYFDATYHAPPLERKLTANDALALQVADDHCQEHNAIIVIVNDAQYGGSGGPIAVCGSSNDSIDIAIHEMGHSAFGLADEYEYLAGCRSGETGQDSYSGGEPKEPNVTADPSATKWSFLFTPGVSVPTTVNPDCTTCDPRAADPEPAGTVGAYEGARYFHCGIFRPAFNCKMRQEAAPDFCPVCQFEIRVALVPLLPPESIVFPDEFLVFEDVPVGLGGLGVTTHRALVWEAVTNGPKTFRVKDRSGLPGVFDFPFGTSVTVGPSDAEPLAIGRIWVSYTSTAVDDTASGTMTVECVETGEMKEIFVGAHTIERPRVSLALVLDCSGSMDDEGADGTRKIDIARRAANVLVDVMTAENALSIVRFDQTAERIMEATLMGDENGGAGRATARGIIVGPQLDPSGSTSIGSGLEAAVEVLADSATGQGPFDTEAVLVLSDGKENRQPFIRDVDSLITADTFAVGIGIPAELNVEALSALTEGLDGYLVMTGAPDNDQETRLKKYFLQILASVSNAEVVLDPHGEVRDGKPHGRVAFLLADSDYGADILVLSPYPQGLDITLVAPDGQRVRPGDLPGSAWARFVSRAGVCYFRLSLPLATRGLRPAHAGKWMVEISLNDKGTSYLNPEKPPNRGPQRNAVRRRALPYDVIVHVYSMLRLRAALQPALAAVGSRLRLNAMLTEFDAPLLRSARVFAEISRSDGVTSRIPLAYSGEGRYACEVTVELCGLHTVRFRAQGRTARGWDFTREQTRTFAVNKTGHDPKDEPTREPPMGWREWTRFLLAAGIIAPDKARLLERAVPIAGGGAKEPRRRRAVKPKPAPLKREADCPKSK
jgi:hypothetical protein